MPVRRVSDGHRIHRNKVQQCATRPWGTFQEAGAFRLEIWILPWPSIARDRVCREAHKLWQSRSPVKRHCQHCRLMCMLHRRCSATSGHDASILHQCCLLQRQKISGFEQKVVCRLPCANQKHELGSTSVSRANRTAMPSKPQVQKPLWGGIPLRMLCQAIRSRGFRILFVSKQQTAP